MIAQPQETDRAGVLNPAVGTVTLWSDLSCPWATLAMHTLHAAAATRGQRLVIDHRAFPLELFNRMPTPRYIVDAEIVAIAGHGLGPRWRPWRAAGSTYPVTMLPAMEAVQAAKDPGIGGLVGSDELDTALRTAFFVDSRCVAVHPVILEVAADCPHVDEAALADALARGAGRAEVYRDWRTANGELVRGSPHLFAADGFDVHNPGATHHWTAPPPEGGVPYLDAYDPAWAGALLDRLADQQGTG